MWSSLTLPSGHRLAAMIIKPSDGELNAKQLEQQKWQCRYCLANTKVASFTRGLFKQVAADLSVFSGS